MIALLLAVLTASVLGSMHCAGMCGAFLAFAVAPGSDGRSKSLLQAAYNGGRLVTYMLLGAIAGAVGAAVDLGGSAVGVQRAAMVLAGAMMVGFGVIAVLRQCGVVLPRMPLPPGVRALVMAGHRGAASWRPAARALATGLLTTLLPCGWLYAFAITAAGTGDPVYGAATMGIFWVGTLPVMVSLGTGFQHLSGPLARRVPLATALLLVAVGLFTIGGRLAMPAMAHGRAAERTEVGLAVQRVEQLPSAELPCCNER